MTPVGVVRNIDKPNGWRRRLRTLEDNINMDPKQIVCCGLNCTNGLGQGPPVGCSVQRTFGFRKGRESLHQISGFQ